MRDGGRVLALRYRAGGCLRGDGRAFVAESRSSVTIQVREHASSTTGGCAGVEVEKTLHVALRAPLGTRAVAGGPRLPDVAPGTARKLP